MWVELVGLSVHPLKVAILEALLWVREPLSASELTSMLDAPEYELDHVAYHLGKLAKLDVVEPIRERRVRGARETYYFIREGFVDL